MNKTIFVSEEQEKLLRQFAETYNDQNIIDQLDDPSYSSVTIDRETIFLLSSEGQEEKIDNLTDKDIENIAFAISDELHTHDYMQIVVVEMLDQFEQ